MNKNSVKFRLERAAHTHDNSDPQKDGSYVQPPQAQAGGVAPLDRAPESWT